MNSSRAGTIISLGNNQWTVKYFPEREDEFKKKQKERTDAGIERRKREEEEKKQQEKRENAIKRQKKREEEIKYQIQLEQLERIKRREEEEKKRKLDRDNKIREKIAEKFAGAKTLMQYRCAGSKGRTNEGTEWGIFIYLRNGKYHRQHESPDRVLIANKPKIVEFDDKNHAIKFCNYLLYKTDNYWYSDTKYLNQADLDLDFPTKNPPNKDELEAAVQSFISYRDMELYSNQELRDRSKKNNINSNLKNSQTNKEDKINDLYKKAEKNINENNFISAIDQYSSILKENPKFEKALFFRGFAKSKLYDHDGAISDYEKSLEINPKNESAFLNIGIARANLSDYKGAISSYSAALNINSSMAKAYFGRAIAKQNLKEFESAIVDYEKSLAIEPNNLDALVNLGISKAYLDRNEGAIESFTKALKINPNNLEVLYFSGVIKSSLNDIEGAIDDLSKIVKIDKKFKDAELKLIALNKKLNEQKTFADPWDADTEVNNNPLEENQKDISVENCKEKILEEKDDNLLEEKKEKRQSFRYQIKDIQSLVDIDSVKKEIKKISNSQKIKSLKEKFSRIELFNLKQTGDWISSFNSKSSISEEDLDSLLLELNSFVGLQSVKVEINKIVNFQRIQRERQSHGYLKQHLGNHMVFYGPPGTGKTMLARLVGKIFRSIGFLSKGHFIETDRSSFVGQHIGETSIKSKKVLESALGGVLFIDEAYSLCSSNSQNDFGPEAISIILKYMEDHRDNLIVIVAGYQEEMFNFLETNPGFKSRFNSFLSFPNYSEKELLEILLKLSSDQGYLIDQDTKNSLRNYLSQISEFRQSSFGNARSMRNLLEIAIKNQANRLMEYDERSKADLLHLKIVDFELDIGQLQEI